ncbi:START domain-containing protein [Chitinophaga filiformis]|uniref:START domain-containing protein n=1 Tax=Chitinophaga filiformis TaxID=104663 RepID=UPI001F269A79|nr:START domain-containing protein [Chitinophaga filiformis]MCF6407594.1 START domain-containing protein [Chitinophaga filiformis]MCF6407701.1 START domain-containing protein [Chitinophaga filiformis]
MKHLSIVSLALLFSLVSFGQETWTLKSNKDGIAIYTKTIENSNYKGIRVKCSLPATLSQFVAVIMDVNTATEWLYSTKSSTLLKQVSPAEVYYYSEVGLPWPLSNRDFVCHLTAKQDPRTKIVTIDGPVVPDYMPEKSGIVRVTRSSGKWIIAPGENNTVNIEYTLEADPGGSIPAWLVNLFATKGPMESFRKLKTQINKPQYKKVQYAFIKN